MKAGRELDGLVARIVMGIDLSPVEHKYGKPPYNLEPGAVNHAGPWTECPEPKYYSTDIEAAWEVVEKLNATGWNVCVASRVDQQYACFITKQSAEQGSTPYRDSVPLAICLAALDAFGVEMPK